MPQTGLPNHISPWKITKDKEIRKEGEEENKYQTKGCTKEASYYPTKRVLADSNSPTIPEFSNIPLGRISQTPIPHHHNPHAKLVIKGNEFGDLVFAILGVPQGYVIRGCSYALAWCLMRRVEVVLG